MKHPAPPNIPLEKERLAALHDLEILDSPPEREFDDLATLAAHICGAPIALITLVDDRRQWFKARTGMRLAETPRDVAFCAHAIAQRELFIVPDAACDPRFAKNPLVTEEQIRFYAGAPLLTEDGHALGTVCVMDRIPRTLEPAQRLALTVFSRHVATQLALRRSVAAQRRAEQALQHSHAELEQRVLERTAEYHAAKLEAEEARAEIADVIERISDGVIGFDSRWNYNYVTQRAGEMLGRKPEELIGKNLWTEFPGGEGEPYYHEFRRAMEQQVPVHLELWYPPWDRWFEARLYPSADGASLFFRDITERKRQEQALRATEERLQLAIEASGIGLWDWNVASEVIYFSPEWKAQLGYLDHEIANRYEEWEQRLHPADRERCQTVIRKYLERPWPDFENEYRLRHRNGSYRWMLSLAKVFPGPDGRAARMLGCHIDITERRATEERLRGSREQLRALAAHLQAVREEEATRIARELHDQLGAALTGLNFEVGWIDRQLKREVTPPKLATMRERVRGILDLIDRTVETVRALCVELRPAMLDQLGLATTIGWYAAEFQTRTGIRCDVKVPEKVSIDPDRATAVFRILQEVLTNVARHARASEVRIALRSTRGEVALDVEDNGCGFAPEAAVANNRFGLVGMKERAIAAGGSVDISSTPGGGTRVAVRVPAGGAASA